MSSHFLELLAPRPDMKDWSEVVKVTILLSSESPDLPALSVTMSSPGVAARAHPTPPVKLVALIEISTAKLPLFVTVK